MDPLEQNYIFDVILLSETLAAARDGQVTRNFSICILDQVLHLSPDRLLTDYFPEKPLADFTATPCDLIGSLSSSGICVVVEENEEILGSGTAQLKDQTLHQLAEQNFKVKEVITVELFKGKKLVGNLRLGIKISSTDPQLDTRLLPFGCYDVCKPVDKSLNPRDFILSLGRSGSCAATTCITDERLMSHAGEPFSCLHAPSSPRRIQDCGCPIKGLKPPPELDQTKGRQRKQLKQLLLDLDIDREKIPTPPAEHDLSRTQRRHHTRSDSSFSLPTSFKSNARTAQHLGETKTYRSPKLCPVCHADSSWLPTIAACPHCGYQDFTVENPCVEPYDESVTASELLRRHFIKSRMGQKAVQERHNRHLSCVKEPPILPKECRCSSSNRICARCRIKELSEQMISKDIKVHLRSSTSPRSKPPKKEGFLTEMRDAGQAQSPCRGVTSVEIKKAIRDLEQLQPQLKKQKKKKTKRKTHSKRYTFWVPTQISRSPVTHLNCGQDSGRVPCHMGWRWTSSELARHRHWKPGAIMKPIRELMAYFLKDYPADTLPNSQRHCLLRRRQQLKNFNQQNQEEDEEPLIQHPTLHITKKHDEYTITLRPLKDAKALAKAANPYANMKPVVFRIVKDPIASGRRQMKLDLKSKGIQPCVCHKPVASCCCRSYVDHKLLEHEVKLLSEQRGWQDISENFIFDDVSDSDGDNELDFGITPPVGVVKPERRRQPDRVNTETQYNENDWTTPTMYPHPPNALIQYGGCVVGERRHRFPWIMGKGYVHQEPKPPKKINKPKEQKKAKQKEKQKGGEEQQKKSEWHKSNSWK